MNSMHKEVISVLIQAGKKDLARAYAKQVQAKDIPNAADYAWEAIETSWEKHSRAFERDLTKQAKIIEKPGAMQSLWKKNLAAIRKHIDAIGGIIGENV